MNTGLGFSEIALILLLVLLFFGSKEIPQFIRVIAKFMARIRFYTDKVKREIDSVTQVESVPQGNTVIAEKKVPMRKKYIAKRKELSLDLRKEKSDSICDRVLQSSYVQKAHVVMLYASMGSEVSTDRLITALLESGKRVVLPYCKGGAGDMAVAQINDLSTDVEVGSNGFPEVIESLRKPFFKSDIELVICPGVAFDKYGGRLGRGKSFYDRFLKELKGHIPLIGLSFDCQVCDDSIPFDYHDISMDQIYTESGTLMVVPESNSVQESKPAQASS